MPFPPSILFVSPPPFFLLFSLSASFSVCRNKAGRAGFAAALLVPDLNFRRISNILVPPAPRPPPTKHREYGPLCVYLSLVLHMCGADSLMPKRAEGVQSNVYWPISSVHFCRVLEHSREKRGRIKVVWCRDGEGRRDICALFSFHPFSLCSPLFGSISISISAIT